MMILAYLLKNDALKVGKYSEMKKEENPTDC